MYLQARDKLPHSRFFPHIMIGAPFLIMKDPYPMPGDTSPSLDPKEVHIVSFQA